MKSIAIYTRVSTNGQDTANQVHLLTEYATKLGYAHSVFEEVQSSRKVRPIKQQLLSELKKKKYDGLLIYQLDRWARSSKELILEIEELISRDVIFISYKENIDFSTAIGKLHFQILAAFAEFERCLISERTKDALINAKMKGVCLGRPKGAKDKGKRKKDGYFRRG